MCAERARHTRGFHPFAQTAGESIAGLRGAGHAFAGNALAGGLAFAAMFAAPSVK
jgi:hypothetical protein